MSRIRTPLLGLSTAFLLFLGACSDDQAPRQRGANAPSATDPGLIWVDAGESATFILTGVDADGLAEGLTVEISDGPDEGALDVTEGAAPLSVTYVAPAAFDGVDNLRFTVVDAAGGRAAPLTVSIVVTAVIQPPVVSDPPEPLAPAVVTLSEDEPTPITLSGDDSQDAVGDLTIQVVEAPAHGDLDVSSGSAPLVVNYTPDAGFSGVDSLQFTVTDLDGDTSAPMTVALVVQSLPEAREAPAPEAPAVVVTAEGTATTFTLTGTDSLDDEADLHVDVTVEPEHGSLDQTAGAAPLTVTYTPEAGFSGVDSLQFTVTDTDGNVSTGASVALLVQALAEPPEAREPPVPVGPALVVSAQDTPATFNLSGTDSRDDEAELAVDVTASPAHGALDVASGAAPLTVTYTPESGFAGFDSLQFTVTDTDGNTSAPTSVVLVVEADAAGAEAPTPVGPTLVSTRQDAAVAFTLSATDSLDDPSELALDVTFGPEHGTLDVTTGAAPLTVTYTPESGFSGVDGLRFTATDSDGNVSAAASVAFLVETPPEPPEAREPPVPVGPALVTTLRDTPATFSLSGTDSLDDEDELTVDVTVGPVSGTLDTTSGPAPLTLTYSPAAGFSGLDSLQFTVTDTDGNVSVPRAVVLSVAPPPPPAAPEAVALAVAFVDEDEAVAIALTGTDAADADADLIVDVTTDPTSGTLDVSTGSAPLVVTYTPSANFNGVDSLSFTVTDTDANVSRARTVALVVAAINDPPVAVDDPDALTDSVTPLVIDALANDSDVDGDALSLVSVTSPPFGSATINADGTITYVPNHPDTGIAAFDYTVRDSSGATDTARVTVGVSLGAAVEILSFSATPRVIELGASTELAWDTVAAVACAIDPDVDIGGSVAGNISVSPTTTTRYTLRCEGPAGPVTAGLTLVTSFDTDGDGMLDYYEVLNGLDRFDPDTDHDGLLDGIEDANFDGVLDPGETDPADPDTDDDGLADGIEDVNRNGVVDGAESDPRDTDTDDDSLSDLAEDTNRNGLRDGVETDPSDPDSDDDGLCDGGRADNDANGIDPVDPCVLCEGRYRVDPDSLSPTPDGCTWASAFPSLEEAMALAVAGDEVWVAEGLFLPSAPNAAVLTMTDGVDVYGGFAGSEGAPADRPTPVLSSVLSGDFDSSGTHTTGDSTHVVLGASSRLDGFVVEWGNATGNVGGGLWVSDANMTVANAVFRNNHAQSAGAIYAQLGDLRLDGVDILGNTAAEAGGGIMTLAVRVTMRHTRLLDNRATSDGSAMRFSSQGSVVGGAPQLTMTQVEVADNEVLSESNGTFGTLVVLVRSGEPAIQMSDVTVRDNRVHGMASGLFLNVEPDTPDAVPVTLSNVRFLNNQAGPYSDAVGGASALYVTGPAALQLDRVDLIGNVTRGNPGDPSIYVGATYLSPDLPLSWTNSRIVGNRCDAGTCQGAGAYLGSPAELTNVVFIDNVGVGPVEALGGGLYANVDVTLTNVTFRGNEADDGGAMAAFGTMSLINAVLWGNQPNALAGTGTFSTARYCADEFLPGTSGPFVELTEDPHVVAASGELFLDPAGLCVDSGSNAAAAGIDWSNLTTDISGALDVSPVDPGYHHDPASVWIATLECTADSLSWSTHGATSCELEDETGFTAVDGLGSITPLPGPYSLTCEGQNGPSVASPWSDPMVFDTSGQWIVTVPSCVVEVRVRAWGAGGGGGSGTPGAAGGFADAWIPVVSGEELTVVVGGAGQAQADVTVVLGGVGGGGDSGPGNSTEIGGSGGGLSGLFAGGNPITFDAAGQLRALVIAGGGAGGASTNSQVGGNSGAGGGTDGLLGSPDGNDAGWETYQPDRVGQPGTALSGGLGCTHASYCVGRDVDGDALQGGDGGLFGGSGGGGGYWGGGGGAAYFNGSGGSGYLDGGAYETLLIAGDRQTPPRVDDEVYRGGVGVGGAPGGANAVPGEDGGDGLVVISWSR